MQFLRRTAGYTLLDHKRNDEILEELKVQPADNKLRNTNQIVYNMYRDGQQEGGKNNAEL